MRSVYFFFAAGLALFYLSLSPGAIAGMGYTGEEMRTGNQILSWFLHPSTHVDMSRNGILPVLIDLPFLAAGHVLFERRESGQDLMLAMEPCILTALIATLVFIWIHRVTADPRHSFKMACASAFCTMLWPYAYIGLETKQSFFLLAAAFLALEISRPGAWPAVSAFCISAAFAIGSKSTGTFLLPAAAYLVWQYCLRLRKHRKHGGAQSPALVRAQAVLCICVPVFAFLLNGYGRSKFLEPYGGAGPFLRQWIVTDVLSPCLNLASFFGSANKGLWVFSPICLLACYALPKAWRAHRKIALFTLLTLGGLAGGFCLLRNWSDETWGPRYLHSAIAPLVIVFAVTWPRARGIASRWIVAATVALGLVAAALGVLFAYSLLPLAATRTDQNTLEGYQGDIALNHLRFNARLLNIWLHPERSGIWTSDRQWFFERPPGFAPPKSIDLHALAIPQPFLLRYWKTPKTGVVGRVWLFYLGCLAASVICFLTAGRRTYRLPKT